MAEILPATPEHLPEVLAWLKAEDEELGTGFYCNRSVIENCFARGDGICAVVANKVVGFIIFQMFTDGGEVHIIEVMPTARGQGLGSKLILAAVEALSKSGAKYVGVECTSEEGEALCRRHGFEDYKDPRNYRSQWANPLLRRYLSDWRPPVRPLWA